MPKQERAVCARIHLPIVALLAIFASAWAFPGDYFMDDLIIVRDNPFLLLPDLKGIWFFDYWGPGVNSGLYRPLTITSFLLDTLLFGHVAWGHHLVNVLLHAGVSLLLYLLARRMGAAAGVALVAALIFAVHPIHGEAVHELVGRAELLVGIFILAGLYLALGEWRWQAPAVAACFLAGLLSKENGIVFLALLPALDLFLRRQPKAVLRQRCVLYPLLAIMTVLWFVFRRFGVSRPLSDLPKIYDPIYVPLSTLEWPERILAALKVQLLYLGKLLVPVSLQGMYPPSTVLPVPPFVSFWTAAILLALMLLAVAGWQGWRERRLWGLAIVCYVISVSPTANLLVLTEVTMAERFAYLPSVWFCVGVASLFAVPVAKLGGRRRTVVVAAVLVVLSLAGVLRSLDFRSPERLWRNDLRTDPNNPLSALFLADELWRLGRLQEADAAYARLVAAEPRFTEGLRTYACFSLAAGRPEQAIEYARRAVATEVGRYAAAYMPLADAYIDIGQLDKAYETLEMGRPTHDRRAIFWEILGKFYQAKGDLAAAARSYEKALSALGPLSDDTFLRLGKIYLELEVYGKAEELLRRALQREEAAEGYNGLGIALVMQGKKEEARQAFTKAVALQPGSEFYRANLERAGR